jgi:hypothetical protein
MNKIRTRKQLNRFIVYNLQQTHPQKYLPVELAAVSREVLRHGGLAGGFLRGSHLEVMERLLASESDKEWQGAGLLEFLMYCATNEVLGKPCDPLRCAQLGLWFIGVTPQDYCETENFGLKTTRAFEQRRQISIAVSLPFDTATYCVDEVGSELSQLEFDTNCGPPRDLYMPS